MIQLETNLLEVAVEVVLLVEVLEVIQVETTKVVEVLVVVLLQGQLSQTEVEGLQEIIQAIMILIMAKEEVEVILHHNQMVTVGSL
jgi:hypothetical protein